MNAWWPVRVGGFVTERQRTLIDVVRELDCSRGSEAFTIGAASGRRLGKATLVHNSPENGARDHSSRKRYLIWFAVALATIATVVFLVVAWPSSTPQSSLNPKSVETAKIDRLWNLVFWIATVIFFLVEGALVVSIVKWRERPGDDSEPKQLHGNTKLEIVWTIIPAVILAVIAVPTMKTLFELRSPAEGPDVLTVNVTGHQWWWEFEYPDLVGDDGQPLLTANELHIPAGITTELIMTSADVLHSFWVPSLAGKRDLVPGQLTAIKMTPDADIAGEEIPGQCAEFCGLSHADMRITVFVDSAEAFDAWAATELQAAAVPTDGPAAAGYESFNQTCTTCHQARVESADGSVETIGVAHGPDLTHFGNRSTLGAGVLANTAVHLAEWIDDPAAVKPMAPELNDLAEGRILGMPDYGLDPQRIDELVALLEGWK